MPHTPDQIRTDDTRIGAVRPLITPVLLQEQLPASEAVLATVERSRAAICDVLHGRDDRLIVVVGPCSIHDHGQAMEYAHWLKGQADALQGELLIVMRTYFEKPRTTVGWKGYINDPHLDGSFSINEGLTLARTLLLDLKNVIYVDSSGADALMNLIGTCRKKEVQLIICGLLHQPLDIAQRSGLLEHLDGRLEPDLPAGIQRALSLTARPGQ